MKRLIIVGASGHGRVVLEAAQAVAGVAKDAVAGFIDDGVSGDIHGIPILGGSALLGGDFLADHRFIVAIGNQAIRRRLTLNIKEKGGELATVIHPTAQVSPTATIGAGTAVIGGVIVNADAAVGEFCILNTGCSIDHDCVLHDGVQICPGVRLSGDVHCGEDAFFGTGAVSIQGKRIGARAVIGAGAVVVRDIPADVVAYGNPARIVTGLG